jgi:Uma2 family endonuclease
MMTANPVLRSRLSDDRLPTPPSRAYAMGMPDTIRWTREQVLSLPADGNRYELVDGELIVTSSPTWRHQRVLAAIFRVLIPYVEGGEFGHVLWSPADLELESGQLTQPDVFVLPGLGPIKRWEDAPLPLLVIEALSPSTARYDRGLKRRFYQRAGVPEYWIVDIDGGVVERWRPGDDRPEVIDGELTWAPSQIVPLVIDVAALFTGLA